MPDSTAESAPPRTLFDRVDVKSDTLGGYGPLFVNRIPWNPGRLKVHQRIASRYAGERTRSTFIAPLGGLRRAADFLFPFAGCGRSGRICPPHGGRGGSGLSSPSRPAG